MTQAIRENAASFSSRNAPGNAPRSAPRARASAKDLAQFQFPGEDVSDADKTLERGRPVASATQEIDLADVLEVEPIDPHPSSVIPVAIDVATRPTGPAKRAQERVEAAAARTSGRFELPRNRLGMGVGAAIFGTGCLVLALVNTSHGAAEEGATAPQAAAATPIAAPPVVAVVGPSTAAAEHVGQGAAATNAIAQPEPITTQPATGPGGELVVSVNSLPRVVPTTGTIRLIEAAAAHRLYIDGAVQAGPSAVVSCGRHMVKVGSAGTAHAMIIGCGEETVIAR